MNRKDYSAPRKGVLMALHGIVEGMLSVHDKKQSAQSLPAVIIESRKMLVEKYGTWLASQQD